MLELLLLLYIAKVKTLLFVLCSDAGRAVSNFMSSEMGNIEWREEMGIGSTLSLAHTTDAKCVYSAALILRKVRRKNII